MKGVKIGAIGMQRLTGRYQSFIRSLIKNGGEGYVPQQRSRPGGAPVVNVFWFITGVPNRWSGPIFSFFIGPKTNFCQMMGTNNHTIPSRSSAEGVHTSSVDGPLVTSSGTLLYLK